MITAPDNLNKALTSYVVTFPSQERLDAYLVDAGLQDRSVEINAELKAVVKTAEDFLWAQEGGVTWSKEFEASYTDHLKSRHPWLDPSAMTTIFAFSKWLCWHEGLNAT